MKKINPTLLEALKRNNKVSNELTRESIRQALIILMNSAQYSDIKMSDIIRKAGVSRSGLYANYKSKEDIIYDIVHVFIEEIAIEMATSISDSWENLFHYVRENKEIINIIIEAGLVYKVLEHMNTGINQDRKNWMTDAMWNGLIFNVLLVWVNNGLLETDQKAAELMIASIKQMASTIPYGVQNKE